MRSSELARESIKHGSSIIIGFLFILLLRPYFTWQNALPGIGFIFFSIFIFKKNHFYSHYFLSALLLIVYIGIRLLRSNLTVSSLLLFFLIPIMLSDDDRKIQFYYRTKRVYSVIIGFSLLVYFCVVFCGFELNNNVIDPWNEEKTYQYSQYPFLVVPYNAKDILLQFRFFSLFEEPGIVGSIAASFLTAEKFNLKNWQNIIIFLSGIFSFSMFFYVITLSLMCYFGRMKMITIAIFVFLVLMSAITYYSKSDFSIKNLYDVRFAHQEGAFVGDNRSTESFDKVFAEFVNSGDFFIGRGLGSHDKIDQVQSYKMVVYDEGFIMFMWEIVVFFTYFFSIPQLKFKTKIISFVYFLLYYYQRPSFVLCAGDFFLLLCIPLLIQVRGYRYSERQLY